VERKGKLIVNFPEMHVWICPSKQMTDAYKSGSGQNQFHYAMNQVLDGLGSEPDGSKETPGFFDGYYYGSGGKGELPISARLFTRPAATVYMFDIYPNSPAGTQRNVATEFQRDWDGQEAGRFHGDYANVLYLDGHVAACTADRLVTDRDHRYGEMIWTDPNLYWGYKPPVRISEP